ncbi:MAG: hydantoinase/oxoprolinase family protein [Acidimicrobiia bacterium]|nr:hydantoinase/oxoprolinase family protein [Acidimicrobiia bacterium]
MESSIGADVGGTFTDLVAHDGKKVVGWKTPTTPNQADGVIDAVGARDVDESTSFLHGTTVATNALLEERGARVALVTSPGYEDVIEIGRQKRPSLYDNAANRPDPLVQRSHRLACSDGGVLVDELGTIHLEAIAVALLDSFSDPSVERDVVAQVVAAFPDIPVSAGVEVSPGFREYERLSTTVLNAYLTPVTAGYLDDLRERLPVGRAEVMTSAGGLLPFAVASRFVGQLTLSGPAGGVVAATALRDFHDVGPVISFDMGGTSTDVCRIGREGAAVAPQQVLDGRVNRVPSMPIRTVGAGGGSIGWVDPGGALRVGPRSAGARPGPAGYGLGGVDATVTDANLVLGYIPAGLPFGGGLELDPGLADAALDRLGSTLALSALEAANGILEVVDAHMERALRSVSVEEGFDPRDASLVAFGGAGGLHAVRLARSLDMKSVLVPPHSGVFSALGLLLARPRLEVLETIMSTEDNDNLSAAMETLAARARDRYAEVFGSPPPTVEVSIDVRYQGQSHEVGIRYRPRRVTDDFAGEHHTRFGFVLEGHGLEIVNGRAVAVGEPPITWGDVGSPNPVVSPESTPIEFRVGTESVMASLWRREDLPPGWETEGPALVVDGASTTLLLPGERLRTLVDGTLEITW